jgi:hypothetical protein
VLWWRFKLSSHQRRFKVAHKAASKRNKALSKRHNRGKALCNVGHSAWAAESFKLFKKFLAHCYDLTKAQRAYERLITKCNKAQQSMTQSVWHLNRDWFKVWNSVFTVYYHLTRFVKMSLKDLLRFCKILHALLRFTTNRYTLIKDWHVFTLEKLSHTLSRSLIIQKLCVALKCN